MFEKSKKFLPYNSALNKRARNFRNDMTAAEKKLWYECLKNFEVNFLRQRPIGNYIVDFYCPKLKLVIEVDGETHLDKNESPTEYDRIRTEYLEKLGLRVLRFWNNDVFNGIDVISEIIKNEIRKF